MVKFADALIHDFVLAAGWLGLHVRDPQHESQLAPHVPHPLGPGTCAVYVFSLSESYGKSCPAGPHRVLKVGKAGPKSNARFQSQHYSAKAAPSTLAASLVTARILWPYLGVHNLTEDQVGGWIRANCDRDNFYILATSEFGLGQLEQYMRAMLGPVFEGG